MKENLTPQTVRVRMDRLPGGPPYGRPPAVPWKFLLIPILASFVLIALGGFYLGRRTAAPPKQAASTDLLEDLVCHGPVDPATTPWVYEYAGQKLYFDRKECMDKFIANPTAYGRRRYRLSVHPGEAPASDASAPASATTEADKGPETPADAVETPAATQAPEGGASSSGDLAPVVEPAPGQTPEAAAPVAPPQGQPDATPSMVPANTDLVTEPMPKAGDPEVPAATPELTRKKGAKDPAPKPKPNPKSDDGPSTVEDVPPPP